MAPAKYTATLCKEDAMSLRTSEAMPISEVDLAEHAGLVLVEGALEGLEDAAAGRVLDEADLDRILADAPAPPHNAA
jgi:hypothetical protein